MTTATLATRNSLEVETSIRYVRQYFDTYEQGWFTNPDHANGKVTWTTEDAARSEPLFEGRFVAMRVVRVITTRSVEQVYPAASSE